MSFGKRMIEMLCSDSIKLASNLLTAEQLLKSEDSFNQQTIISFIEDDEIKPKSKSKSKSKSRSNKDNKDIKEVVKVKRLYVRDIERNDDGVGWILNECIDKCMICNATFDSFCWKHHCRACGNVVCDACSTTTVQIVELAECHFQRACDQCAQIQYEIVHAKRLRLRETDIIGRANYFSISLLKKEKDYNKLNKALKTPELLEEIRLIKQRLIELKEEEMKADQTEISQRLNTLNFDPLAFELNHPDDPEDFYSYENNVHQYIENKIYKPQTVYPRGDASIGYGDVDGDVDDGMDGVQDYESDDLRMSISTQMIMNKNTK